MDPIAKTFYNMGPASTDYEPRHDFDTPRDVEREESPSPFEAEPLDEERTDYSYDPEEDLFLMHLRRKMEENY
jgi:hypothetical protein